MTIRDLRSLRSAILLVGLSLASAVGCSGVLAQSNSDPVDTTETALAAASVSPSSEVSLLSAFFGLDDALPVLARLLVCDGGIGRDGMPVVLSRQIDVETMQAGDFRVVLEDGSPGEIVCATPAPANDLGELRTILLIGDFGSVANQPAQVEVVGNLVSSDGAFNFRGVRTQPVRLEEGPSLVLAQPVPPAEWELGKRATRFPFGGGDGCPVGTRQVVRAVWNGGVTKPGGDEIDEVERLAYRVLVEDGGGRLKSVTPFAIGDLGDGDNNHELCLDTEARAQRVEFPAGLLTDPREDLNPSTSIRVSR